MVTCGIKLIGVQFCHVDSIRSAVHGMPFLLEENIGRTLFDTNSSNIFLDPPPRVMKIKINRWELIKLKNFCTEKETINKTKTKQNKKKTHRMGENICKQSD